MAKKTASNSEKMYYNAAKADNRAVRNRTRRLKAHISEHPNDSEAQAALARGLSYRRKKPASRVWKSKSLQRYAQTLAKLGYNGNLALNKQRAEVVKEETPGTPQ